MLLSLALLVTVYAFLTREWLLLSLAAVFIGTIFLYFFLLSVFNAVKKKWPLNKRREKIFTFITLLLTIVISVAPMGLSPVWNGEIPEHRNQYELLANSLLEGKLYIDYEDIDPNLLKMENPYDPAARGELHVNFHWDHAFYNGHYYVYFGIVPALVLFVPYRIITGNPLTTYHATQVFTLFFIIGLFALFQKIKNIFFKDLSTMLQIFIFASFSLVSVWYISGCPALYCTAISSGICFSVWSLYFFVKAVFVEQTENRQILAAFIGSFLGALVFGCRPPIGMANIIVLPLLITFLRSKKISIRLILKLLVAALPYLVVGVLLMLYNYARFDSILEFGQRYQLTAADQHAYSVFRTLDLRNSVIQLFYLLFAPYKLQRLHVGLFIEYPVFLLCLYLLAGKARILLKDIRLWGIFISVILIILMQLLYSPYMVERYKSDYLYLLCIIVFTAVAYINCCYNGSRAEQYRYVSRLLVLFSATASILLFMIPNDRNFTEYYYDDIIAVIHSIMNKLPII